MYIDVNIVRIVSLNLNNVEANISINIFEAYNLTFLSLYTSSKVCANIWVTHNLKTGSSNAIIA